MSHGRLGEVQIGRRGENNDDEQLEDEVGGHERQVPTIVGRSGPGFPEEK